MSLQRILVRARRQVLSEMVGNNPSVLRGEGYDFVELREYLPGDDIRHINWTVTAKMHKPYIKIFKEERQLQVVIASMLGGSVYFGVKRMKQDVIAELAAMLGYAVLYNNDVLQSMLFSDRCHYIGKPSKRYFSVQEMTDEILSFDPRGKQSGYDVMTETLMKRLRKRSLIIIIADFFSVPQMRALAKKHEVICLIVRERFEERPEPMGLTSLKDPENYDIMEGDFNAKTVAKYAAKVSAHDRDLYERLRHDGIRFMKIYTDDHLAVSLRRLFESAV